MLSRLICRIAEKKYSVELINKKVCVTLGFTRSGTSVLASIANHAGYSLGKESDIQKGNNLNPKGFYANTNLSFAGSAIMREAGYQFANEVGTKSLRPKGVANRLRRYRTRTKFAKALNKILEKDGSATFKASPHPFHILQKQLKGSYKVLGIYREPLTSVISNLERPLTHQTFCQLLDNWKSVNEEMLYHISKHQGLLIKYEDLVDPGIGPQLVSKVSDYLDSPKPLEYKQIVDENLNRTPKNHTVLRENWVMPQEVERTLQLLNNSKLK